MAKRQNFYYVMVMTDNGPTFVTKINYSNKTAEWNKLEKPLLMDKFRAEDLTMGLNLNWHEAFMICSKFELDTQPYLYDRGEFVWQSKDAKEKEVEKGA